MNISRIDSYMDLEIPEGYGVIYEYTILSIGKSYIGQTIDLMARHRSHCLDKDRLCAYLRHGDYNLSILDIVPIDKLDEAEMSYIRANNTLEPHGLNYSKGGRKNDIVCKKQNNSVPRSPSEKADRFKSRVFKLDGSLFIMIPHKISESNAIEPDDVMDVWVQHHQY